MRIPLVLHIPPVIAVLTTLLLTGPLGAQEGATADQSMLEGLMSKGKDVYDKSCAVCHQQDGMGLSGSFPPLVQGAEFQAPPFVTQPLEERGFLKNGKIQLGPLKTHIDVVVNGIPGTRMFAFGQQLSDEEIAAVVTYERNAWGNDSGDIVQPAQVSTYRR